MRSVHPRLQLAGSKIPLSLNVRKLCIRVLPRVLISFPPCRSELKTFQLSNKTMVLLLNGGFCNGCITKRILLLQAFHSQENQYYADYDKNITFFINSIFYHRKIVKLDHFMTLSLSYANTVLGCSHCKIHRFVAAPKP